MRTSRLTRPSPPGSEAPVAGVRSYHRTSFGGSAREVIAQWITWTGGGPPWKEALIYIGIYEQCL
jgi:hypothetical protein